MSHAVSSKYPLVVALAFVVGTGAASAFQATGAAKAKGKEAATAKIDVNSADAAALEALPQIGSTLAKKIVDHRPYKNLGELETRAGLNARALESIKDRVVFGASSPATATRSESAAAGSKKVDVNTAEIEELSTLPGIGPSLAKAIIDGRPYGTFDDLDEVKGLGPAKLAKIKDLVVVGSTTADITIPKSDLKPETGKSVAGKSSPFAKKAPLAPGVKINLNTATLDQLATLPGIGRVKAQAIIDGRPFNKPEDVMDVKGIKGATFDRIKDHVSVE